MRNTITVGVKDEVSRKLQDDQIKVIDMTTENVVINTLIEERTLPRVWQKTDFNPAGNLKDTVDLLTFVWPDRKWGLRCDGIDYAAWVEAEDYTVYGPTAERALFFAMWTWWRVNHDGETE